MSIARKLLRLARTAPTALRISLLASHLLSSLMPLPTQPCIHFGFQPRFEPLHHPLADGLPQFIHEPFDTVAPVLYACHDVIPVCVCFDNQTLSGFHVFFYFNRLRYTTLETRPLPKGPKIAILQNTLRE
jgi:hypothetical protein